MKLVVDANVFLAFVIPEEAEHAEALAFFAHGQTGRHRLLFPSLALPEIAGGVARRKRDQDKALLAVNRFLHLEFSTVVPLSTSAAESAAKLASRHFLRGADAVYCQLAHQNHARLVTFDTEIKARVGKIISVISPGDWLKGERL